MKNCIHLFLFLFSFSAYAQIPAGYYNDAEGLTGYSLKTALHNIIDDHNDQGYNALWSLYEISDVRADGKVWDIYADCDFEFGKASEGGGDQDEGSGGTVECDKFNREHTFPQSWFGGSGIMRNDPFHVLPTDKKVNSVRGNFAYGEVSNPTYTSGNGSKLGSNIYPGYAGIVFEPIDEYKGDIARGYFYMATRYEDLIDGWEFNDDDGNAMLNGTTDQVYETWALNMLIEWHSNDPVSQKEIDRNDAIYDYQGNRNPFIDHPEYVACIWQSDCGGASPTPSISVDENLTDFGTVAFGNVSTTQSYAFSGSDLTANLEITVSDNFQIAEVDNDADYTKAISITPTSGSITNKTIFVRFNPTSEINGVVNGQIVHSSTGASDVTINVSAAEQSDVPPPSISLSKTNLEFGTIAFESASTAQSYTINANDLTADLVITSSNSFEISLENADQNYGNSLNIIPESGSIADQVIFVRFKPAANTNALIEGTVSHTSAGLAEQVINVSGTEEADAPATPEINFNFNQLIVRDNNTYEVKLFSDVAPAQDMSVTISQNSVVNMASSDFMTTPSITNGIVELTWESGVTTAAFDFKVTNSNLFAEASVKSMGFVLNSSSDNSYSIGTNSSITLFIEGEVINTVESEQSHSFLTYPNPATDVLNIQIEATEFEYSILNLSGKTIITGSQNNKTDIDVSNLLSGVYILRLSTAKRVTSSLIVIE